MWFVKIKDNGNGFSHTMKEGNGLRNTQAGAEEADGK